MKLGNSLTALVLSALLLGAAVSANAATRDINIYGCSAQFFLWSTLAPGFLTASGCTVGTPAYDSTGQTHFMVTGTSCSAFAGDTVNIRVTYHTSNDAIWSLNGVKDPENTKPCANGFQRQMASTVSGSLVTGTACTTVTLGASDEGYKYFTQQTHGHQYGMWNASTSTQGPWINRCFTPVGTNPTACSCIDPRTSTNVGCEPAVDGSDLSYYNPIVDPTAFYVNKAVTITRCVTSNGTQGDMCTATTQAHDCTGPGATGVCGTPEVLDNISRSMAVQIFTGQAYNWTDLGAAFTTSLPIVACMRHTGAGTHITFDYAAMGDTHGWLPASVLNSESTSSPTAYFYDTITTMLGCVNGVTGASTTGGSAIGAIGYTDADRSTSLGLHTSMLNYNGVLPSRRNVRNGLYDDFWSVNYLYYNPTYNPVGSATYQVFNAFYNYENDPAKITTLGSGTTNKGLFWATVGEMVYMKNGADLYPGYVGATTPQTP
jgi:hypothetical protein